MVRSLQITCVSDELAPCSTLFCFWNMSSKTKLQRVSIHAIIFRNRRETRLMISSFDQKYSSPNIAIPVLVVSESGRVCHFDLIETSGCRHAPATSDLDTVARPARYPETPTRTTKCLYPTDDRLLSRRTMICILARQHHDPDYVPAGHQPPPHPRPPSPCHPTRRIARHQDPLVETPANPPRCLLQQP